MEQKPSDLKRGMNVGVGLMIGIAVVLIGGPMLCCMSGSFISAMNDLFGDDPPRAEAPEPTSAAPQLEP